MSPIDATDIDKIKQLIATATTAKQKQMYQNLLVEAEEKLKEQQKELAEQQENTPTESAENVGQIKDDGQDKKDDVLTNVKRKKRKKRKKKKQEVISEKKLPEKEDDNELADNSSKENEEDDNDNELIDNSSENEEDDNDNELIDNSSENEEDEDSNKYGTAFQAVGVVQGKVTECDEKLSLELGGKNYPLFYANTKFWAYKGFKKQIALTGKDDYPLMVYPKITHFPQKHQPHNIYFQLVAFDAGNHPELQQTTFTELNEGEFKIFGLWQFIPPSRLPCISVFRNYSPKLLEYIKQGELAKKVQITKATHVPIIWKDSPVQPFRFNPKLKKEEQKPLYFVSIKAKFLPEKNLFLFIEQLAEPTQDVPRFLKTRKEDKMELNKLQNKTRKKSSFKKGVHKSKKYPKPSKKPAPISKGRNK